MIGEIDEIGIEDYDDDYDCHRCPYTKKICYTPWLMGDCPNDCAFAHNGNEDW